MARRNRDIAGLLTGIPSGGYASRMADLSREMGTMFGSGITGMMTGDVRTPTQQLTGDIKNFVNLTDERKQAVIGGLQARGQTGVANQLLAGEQQRVNKAMADLDLSNPEDLIKLARVQQTSGDLKSAVSTLNTAKKLQQQAGLKEGLLKIARSQGNQEMIDFIEAGGSLQTASTKLLADKTTKPKTYSLGSSDIAEYDLYFEDIDEDFLKTIGYDTPFIGKLDKTDKMKLFTKAEQMFANNLSLGREGALKQALALKARGGSVADVPTTSGATPRGQQKDPYSSVKE